MTHLESSELTPKGALLLWGTIGSLGKFHNVNFHCKYKNVLNLWRYNFFFHQVFRKGIMLPKAKKLNLSRYLQKYQKKFQFFVFNHFSCGIDPHIQGKL
jgi:hypothetical protein